MTGVTFRPAVREDVRLLLGLAGGTGSGKTYSAMRLAKGLAGGQRFAVVDTENGRARHYADDFAFDAADLTAPFRPERYSEAIEAADRAGYPVVLVDSMSHEWAGDGGMLDWQEEELERMGGREAAKMSAWIKPKQAHRKFVTRLLQVRCHVILCFRAAERVEMVRGANGKMEVKPKRSLTGLDGWIPITEKDLPFELTMSCLLMADAPGQPKPIKLPEQLKPFVPLDRPITEATGEQLAVWAAGAADEPSPEEAGLADELLDLAAQLGKRPATQRAVEKHRREQPARHVEWLEQKVGRGMIFPDAYDRDQPEPEPWAPCWRCGVSMGIEDGEDCESCGAEFDPILSEDV
jgi:hypothetical protein